YNEAQRIVPSLEKILAFLPGRFEAAEVLLVDDGRTDRTGALRQSRLPRPVDDARPDGPAALVESRFPGRVRVLRQPRRSGKGSAVRAGVLAARMPWVLFVDAGLSIPSEETRAWCARA